MRKIFLFAVALIASVNMMAETFDWNCPYIYRYMYSLQDGTPYYSVQVNSQDYDSFYFGFKDASGPQIGTSYTMADFYPEQSYGSRSWSSGGAAIVYNTVSFARFYDGNVEKFDITVTDTEGNTYNLHWTQANVPSKVEDTVKAFADTMVCDYMDYVSYRGLSPLNVDYNNYNFNIAFPGQLPDDGVTNTLLWKNNSIYIGNTSFSIPNDWSTSLYDAKVSMTGTATGVKGTAWFYMTNGHCYSFDFKYEKPYAESTEYLSGYDMKINNWGTVVFAWQNGTYSVNLAINSADTIGNWKGNDIIISNCSFQLSATYTSLGVYAIDSIYVTRGEDGYIHLQSSILCKNNVKYVLDISNQESPYYVKYDTDGTGVKWQIIPAATYGTGRTMNVRYSGDSVWFNAEPTDEGADGYAIKEIYGTYGDPLWLRDSITISYDPNSSWTKLSVYMVEKYFDLIIANPSLNCSYQNVDGDGVWYYSFSQGSYASSDRWAFNFGIICPIDGPKQYTTYTLDAMTDDYHTKGYDPEYNEIKYADVNFRHDQVWPANNDVYTALVLTSDGKAIKIADTLAPAPTAVDTVEISAKGDIRQQEYWFQFESETGETGYRTQIALTGAEIEPTTFYWATNTIYKPATYIYNSNFGVYVALATGGVQVNATETGYTCDAYFVGYDAHCYHALLTYSIPVAEDTVVVECKDLQISNYGQNNINFSAFNNEYQVNLNIATADTFGVFKNEVKPGECSVALNYTPFTSSLGYSVDSIEVSIDDKGIITLTGGLLCKNNVYYSIRLTSEVTPYYLGVPDKNGFTEWFAMTQGFYQDGRASGAWDYETTIYADSFVYINNIPDYDDNAKKFYYSSIYTVDDLKLEKFDTVNFQYNVYYKEVFATSVKKYAAPTDFYLVGLINGVEYGIGEDIDNFGDYKFVDGKIVVTFTDTSYVQVKNNKKEIYSSEYYYEPFGELSCILTTGYSERLGVDPNVEYEFTIAPYRDIDIQISYIATPVGLNNVKANKKAIKQIVNGQVVIVRDGKQYNILGTAF